MKISLGLDVGTTNIKALALDEQNNVLKITSVPTPWVNKENSMVESEPDLIFQAILKCISLLNQELLEMDSSYTYVGLGITGMAETGTIVSSDGKVLMPAVAWFDARGEEEMNSLGEKFKIEFQSITGLVFKPENSLSTLLWFKENGFDFNRTGIFWLNLLEYVAYRLTGNMAMEPSLASRTGMYEQKSKSFWSKIHEILGVPESLFPQSKIAGESWGEIGGDFSIANLRAVPVTVAGHDHAVSAVGCGSVHPNQVFNSTGTSDAIFRSVSGELTDEQRLKLTNNGVSAGSHIIPGNSACIGGSRGGLVLRRTLELLGLNNATGRQILDDGWEVNSINSNSVRFENNKSISNELHLTILGEPSPQSLWKAALVYMTSENSKFLDHMDLIVGPYESSMAAGGWIKMQSVRDMKSRTMRNLVFSEVEEPGAFGAALLAKAL
jgi:sugar (pentulose or hexulose) kinase